MKNNIDTYFMFNAVKCNNPKQNQDKDEELIPAEPIEPWVPEGPELDLDELYEDEKK